MAEIQINYFSLNFQYFDKSQLKTSFQNNDRFYINSDLIHSWHYINCRYDFVEKRLVVAFMRIDQ